MALDENKQKAIELAIKQIDKAFGKGALIRLGDKPVEKIDAISTGSLGLGIALGIGGLPRGRIIEIYGPESSGKTTLALHCIAEGQKKGGNVAFIDVEHALDPAFAESVRVDINSLLVSQPDSGEQALEICEALVRSNAVDIIDDIVVNTNNLEPSDIIFEIHERYFAHETTMFDMTIKALAGKGYKVIISRFGSDHTAIHTIRRLPITGIKFHGEFFGVNMADDKEKIMLKNLVSMAKELGMTVACGGIHTKLQEEYALSIGCDVFEGDMYYGKVKSAILEKCFLS